MIHAKGYHIVEGILLQLNQCTSSLETRVISHQHIVFLHRIYSVLYFAHKMDVTGLG